MKEPADRDEDELFADIEPVVLVVLAATETLAVPWLVAALLGGCGGEGAALVLAGLSLVAGGVLSRTAEFRVLPGFDELVLFLTFPLPVALPRKMQSKIAFTDYFEKQLASFKMITDKVSGSA